MHIYIDHCALLVENIEDALHHLPADLNRGKIHSFVSEGTRELYLHHHSSRQAAILLMQPIGEGPYQKAMKKRGPGIHHICIRVDNIGEFCEEIAGSGFLLHPSSLRTFSHGVVYLCRPGIPLMLEVENLSDEHRETHAKDGLIASIGLPLAANDLKIVQSILGEFVFSSAKPVIKLNRTPGSIPEILSLEPMFLRKTS